MWKWLAISLAVFRLSGSSAAQMPAPAASDRFHPPELISVAEIADGPCDFVANFGTAVFDILIDETGQIKDIEVRRDLSPSTVEAVQTIKQWKFSPATVAGRAVASRITVAFNIRPQVLLAQPSPLPPLIPQTDQNRIQQAFQPAEVTRSAYPEYPVKAFQPEAVVLEVTVNDTGKALGSRVLLDRPPFTPFAVDAVKNWRFMPAAWEGRPIASKVILAFVFRYANWPGTPVEMGLPASECRPIGSVP
ncbi:MAG: energy transducer TonB [Terriglobia bacterium]